MNQEEAVVEPLIFDLLEWLATRERSYEECMNAWRTSCPRLPVWEAATGRGLVATEETPQGTMVKPTSLGLIELQLRRERIRV
jgi:hypothetical protein